MFKNCLNILIYNYVYIYIIVLFSEQENRYLTLVMMGDLQTLVLMGGGGPKVPPHFLFLQTM